jgi:hypothetical protein
MNEREYFERLIGKFLKIVVPINGYDYRYNGKLIQVLDDQILFEDIKTGQVLIRIKSVTVLSIEVYDKNG